MTAPAKVLLIITGGIAACKSLDLIRLMRKQGIDVQCILTRAAEQFVTPLSVETLSNNRIATELFDLTTENEIGHINLSREADIILVAPATAHFMAKIANGFADDLASTVAIAADKPLHFVPAMNVRMWTHSATQRNVACLHRDGHIFIGPTQGVMACGEYGYGRMSEPDEILASIISRPKPLSGLRAVVTVGATREPVDPVRYLTNHSSGKQGLAIVKALHDQGATVDVINGTGIHTTTNAIQSGVNYIPCTTAQNMYEAVHAALKTTCDIFVGCAAVSDWRPANIAAQKMKKQNDKDTLTLEFVKNPDILAFVSQLPTGKRPALVVGFAAETENLVLHAQEKRRRKKCDWIIANDVSTSTGVMGGDNNTVVLIDKDTTEEWPVMSKTDVATQLVNKITYYFQGVQTTC